MSDRTGKAPTMVERRLIEGPQWTRRFEVPDFLMELPGTVGRRLSSLLDSTTDSLSRFIEATEVQVGRRLEQVQALRTSTMTRVLPRLRTTEPRTPAPPARVSAPAVPHTGATERSWPAFVSEKFLTIAIVVASVVLILMALRTMESIAASLTEFFAGAVNTFLTRLGFPPAL